MPRKANTAAEENVTASENTQEATEIMQEDPIQKTNLETEIDISEETEKAGGIEDEADVDEVAEPDVDDGADVDEVYDVEIVEEDASADKPAASNRNSTGTAPRMRRRNLARREERERQQAQAEAQIANESALISAIHTQRIFTDKVAAVEEVRVGDHTDVAAIVLLGKAFKVIIPYDNIFKESPVNPSEFNNLEHSVDRFNFMRRKRRYIQRMIGGEIPFCLTAYEQDGDHMVLLGSRVRAMEIRSRDYFGGERPRYKVGDVVSAKITSVNNSSIVVLVGGMDVVIRQRQLTRRFYLDLHDGYKVGQDLLAVLTDVKTDEKGMVTSVTLDPIRIELEDAKSRYHVLRDNGRTKAIITRISERTSEDGRKVRNMFAYLPTFDLFARIVRMDANAFGHVMTVGTQVMVRVIKDGHSEDGYLLCHAEYDYGNNGMFNANIYR